MPFDGATNRSSYFKGLQDSVDPVLFGVSNNPIHSSIFAGRVRDSFIESESGDKTPLKFFELSCRVFADTQLHHSSLSLSSELKPPKNHHYYSAFTRFYTVGRKWDVWSTQRISLLRHYKRIYHDQHWDKPGKYKIVIYWVLIYWVWRVCAWYTYVDGSAHASVQLHH